MTCEALYHLMGGWRAGWKPMNMPHGGDSHWFLLNTRSGQIIDPTAAQFEHPPTFSDYARARGRGFLTRGPSKRARALMAQLLWQEAPAQFEVEDSKLTALPRKRAA